VREHPLASAGHDSPDEGISSPLLCLTFTQQTLLRNITSRLPHWIRLVTKIFFLNMDSNGNPLAVVRLAKQSIFPRLLKTFRRRLRECENCTKKVFFAFAELEISAAGGCQMCSLILEAVQYCVPRSLLHEGELRWMWNHDDDSYNLRWRRYGSSPYEVENRTPGDEASIHIQLYISHSRNSRKLLIVT
jgi:hypothetical protein